MENSVQVLCIGQAVVDCITRAIRKDADSGRRHAESITLSLGGDAVNEALALNDMGVRGGLMCVVGNDLAGQFILHAVRQKAIDTSRVTICENLVTPVADIIVEEDGSRSSITCKATLLPGYVPDPKLLSGARIISFASLFRAPLDQAEVIRSLLHAAHDSGAVICADTKLPTLRRLALCELEDVLPLIDYLFPNEEEAAWYTGKDSLEEMGKALLAFGIKHVIIKAGSRGCYACSEEEAFFLPALDVPVIDTTGAGDNFAAGFITSLLAGASFRECCKRGIERAAYSIQIMGGNYGACPDHPYEL